MIRSRSQMRYCSQQWQYNRGKILAGGPCTLFYVNRLSQWLVWAIYWREVDREDQKYKLEFTNHE